MTTNSPRVAVVGVGAVGSMAMWRLAKRGIDVTGYEQHQPGHDGAAFGGRTRLVRVISQRASANVPLLQQAKKLWADLEIEVGRSLVDVSGALTIGPREDPDLLGVIRCAEDLKLPYELIGQAEMAERFPHHRLSPDEVGFYDPLSGVARSNVGVRAAADAATELGAEIREGQAVVEVRPSATDVVVVTDSDEQHFDHVVITAGPWVGRVLPDLRSQVTPRRVISTWFRQRDGVDVTPAAFPPGMRRFHDRSGFTFFPSVDEDLVKVNLWVPLRPEIEDMTRWDVTAEPAVVEATTTFVATSLPGLDPEPVSARAYPEGFTPDRLPLVGLVDPRVTALTGFSGIGFALSPLMGDVAADLALRGATDRAIEHFDIARAAAKTRS